MLVDNSDTTYSEHVEAAVVDTTYDQGFGLSDGTPAPFVDGLALAGTEVIDYALQRRVVAAPEVEEDTQV